MKNCKKKRTGAKRQLKDEKDNIQSVQKKRIVRSWGLATRLEPKNTKGKKNF